TQPIASARINARAAHNFLEMQPPDRDEVRQAVGSVVGDAERAKDIIERIREHLKKAPPRKGRFDLNLAINEIVILARSAITKNGRVGPDSACRRIVSGSRRSRSTTASRPEPCTECSRSTGLS